MDKNNLLQLCSGFEWDNNNIDKNWIKHNVNPIESEQIFFNQPLLIADDEKHSQQEKRFYALGRTDFNRYLFVAFTIRNFNIRIISARDMNIKEKIIYEKC